MARGGLLIGEVAKRSGHSRKAVRLYEARGILPPARRTRSGYRVYPSAVLGILAFVEQGRRLGLTLSEIQQVVAIRRSGSAPCDHVRRLLEQKAADLASLLSAIRLALRSLAADDGRPAVVCPHIEGNGANGGAITWMGSVSRSALGATTARKSSSTATRSTSARPPTRRSARRLNGTSLST